MSETIESIRSFWFGTKQDDAAIANDRAGMWWSKHPAIDAEIRQRFETCVKRAAADKLDTWKDTPGGWLALILLTDQFPRNMYRDTPRAFGFDPLALSWSKQALEAGIDAQLRPVERVFLYLPLEHSESLPDQEQAVALFRKLLADVVAAHKPTFEGFLDFAVRHHDIVKRFGRFPHRNKILGRESSAEEQAFLQEKGSSF